MNEENSFELNEVGQDTSKLYQGKFTVKPFLNRRDNFVADERRRIILGINANSAPPALLGEAYMLGQLLVRLTNAPDWWTKADGGLDVEDANIIGIVFRKMEETVQATEKSIAKKAKAALNKMAQNTEEAQDKDSKEK